MENIIPSKQNLPATKENTEEKKISIIAKKIIHLLSKVKRITKCSNHHEYNACVYLHQKRIEKLIRKNLKITFVLPAYPAKSPNRNKTFSVLPDLGEWLSLHFLNQICESIKQFYSPGAEMIICSDGRVFNDLVSVSDINVDLYSHAINHIIDQLEYVNSFSLDDYYQTSTYELMRKSLIHEFSDSIDVVKKNIKNDSLLQQQFNGIHRFIFEDRLVETKNLSKNKLRNICKDITYLVIQRSNAWSYLLKKSFPDAIRLSIHPQICGSNKLGIMLLESRDIWATPWHRVTMYDGEKYVLIRKQDAESLNLSPVFIENKFSHYSVK